MTLTSNHWRVSQFKAAPIEIIDGDRGQNYPKQADFSRAGHCLFLNAGNVTREGFAFEDCSFITEGKDQTLRKGKLKRGDTVLTTRGTVGNVAFYDESVPFENVRINSGMVIFRPKQSELVPRFFYYFLKSSLFLKQVHSLSTGSAQPQLPIRDLERIEMPIPGLSEQRTIAHVLGTLDDKIKLNQRMNETLEDMAQALFKSWFVDATANGLHEGWHEGALDEIAHFLNGLALQKYPPAGEGSLPVIKISQLRAGNTDGGDRANANLPSEYVVADGDVLFSWSGSLEVVLWCGGCGALNQHLFKVTSQRYPKWFYYLWTKHHLPEFQEIASAKATTMGHIQRHHLSEAEVLIPPAALLQEMDTKFSPLINKTIANNIESRTLRAIRDALIPQLLTGELVISGAEF